MEIPVYLETVFENNLTVIQKYHNHEAIIEANLVFNRKNIGELKISTGQIIACDPFEANDMAYIRPLNTLFPTGNFSCELAIAKINDLDERVGFVRIKFSENKPVQWVLARETNSEQADYRYSVDSGCGGFLDISAQLVFKKMMDADEDYWEAIQEELTNIYTPTWSALIWEIDETNMAFCSSGFGDGVYPTYIGYDENNAICRLVTDFEIIDESAKFI